MGHYGLHELPAARNAIELFLCGSGGTSLARYHDMQFVHTSPDGTEVTEDPLYALRHHYFNSEVHGMHYGEFANYAEHFARALIDGTPHAPDLEEGLRTFCVMEAVRRSARDGGEARVEPALPLLRERGSRLRGLTLDDADDLRVAHGAGALAGGGASARGGRGRASSLVPEPRGPRSRS